MIDNKMKMLKGLAAVICSLLLLAPAWAEKVPDLSESAPSFWKVEGEQNTLWLFGSVHVLTKEHYPLADKVEQAYAASPNLVVEVDVVNLDPMAMQQAMAEVSTLPPGTTLRSLLGEERYAKASELATASGYNLEQMSTYRPWLVSLIVAMTEFGKLGYTPDQGVETYFLKRAGADGKAIIELETAQFQLDVLAGMGEEAEVAGLMQTLELLPNMEEELRSLMSAWEAGDLEQLEASLLESFADYPEVYDQLIVKRNQNWMPELTKMLEAEEDCFVVVGALHLVGEEGVANLLRGKGYKVTMQ